MKKTLFASLLVLAAVTVSAQEKTAVTGTVRTTRGETVAGAAVMVDGTHIGAATGPDGRYTLILPGETGKGAVLTASSLLYKSRSETWGGRAVVDFTLEEDTRQLDEVVVVGYGAMRRSDLTGAVTSVKVDEDKAAQSGSLDRLLQGQAAGVQVVSNSMAPDAGISITVRGASSFNSGSQPLYVVDGVILNTDTGAVLGSHAGGDAGADEPGNGLIGINPQDIARIEILKDASATAIYGSQGANGVVLITTKAANREKPTIAFVTGLDINTLYKKKEMLSFDEYRTYLEMKASDPVNPPYENTVRKFTTGIESGKYEPVDWLDFTTRTSVTQRYYLAVSGRPQNTDYRFSIGYNDNKGVVRGTGYKNLTARLNLDHSLRKVSFGVKMSFSLLSSRLTQGAATKNPNAASSMMRSMLASLPLNYIDPEDEDGFEAFDPEAPLSGPKRWLSDFESNRKELRVTPSLYAQYQILPWLSFRSSFGADYRTTEQDKFKSSRINTASTGATGAIVQTDRLNWNWDNLLLVEKSFGRHKLSGTGGQSASSSGSGIKTSEGTNVEQWKLMTESLNEAPYCYLGYSETYSQLLSFFGRLVYQYADRYVVTATYRFDGSSKFSKAHQWGRFPSAAFAWRITEEPWFHVPVISSLKMRLGWGMVGNQGIPSYQTRFIFKTGTFSSHQTESGKTVTNYSQNLPNYNLKWETTRQYNAGLDLGLWRGRLAMTVDAYHKTTSDLLQTRVMSASAGVSNPYVNMGSIRNVGTEITLSGIPVLTSDFEWTLDGNISFNRNKILSINPGGTDADYLYLDRNGARQFVDFFVGDNLATGLVCRDYINLFATGQPMGLFYAMPTDGIVQEGQTGVPLESEPDVVRGPGSVNYVDTNGDGVISLLDRCVVGDPNPDFIYGFSTTLRYRGLSLGATFVGSYGNDIYNQNDMMDTDVTDTKTNRLRACVFDAWTPENSTSKYPAVNALRAADIQWASDRYVEDGSYLRLSSVSLSWELPLKNPKRVIRRANLGVSGKNLFVWTSYSGWDPDVNSYGTSRRMGVDIGSYPGARSYLLDLKLYF